VVGYGAGQHRKRASLLMIIPWCVDDLIVSLGDLCHDDVTVARLEQRGLLGIYSIIHIGLTNCIEIHFGLATLITPLEY
jgi:hypothetical protein